jgi:hypothetical protein
VRAEKGGPETQPHISQGNKSVKLGVERLHKELGITEQDIAELGEIVSNYDLYLILLRDFVNMFNDKIQRGLIVKNP